MNIKKLSIVIIAIFFALVFIIYFYLTQPIKLENKIIYIPKGSTDYIIKKLSQNGINLNKLDKYIIEYYGYPQAGWIEFNKTTFTRLEFLHELTRAKAALNDISIIPGETTIKTLINISKSLKLNLPKLIKECNAIGLEEGDLYPDTYKFAIGIDEKKLCKTLYYKSLYKHIQIAKKYLKRYNKEEFEKYLIIASIIQKEAANDYEKPLISAVIYNRLKKHMKLQMDGSLNYGLYSHERVTKDRILNDNTTYNTYKHYGLPNKPVCIVDENSIKAAIFPANVKYLYFVKQGDKHIFATTYKEHLKNVRKRNN